MKLLFDQNLSARLLPLLESLYPESKHVKDLGMSSADDETIWRFAAENEFVIITKDTDFMHRSMLRGHPPKVIQLTLGNCSTAQILALLQRDQREIQDFVSSETESLLVIK